MPIYEYECTGCGHHKEVLQKASDPQLVECELCHDTLKRLISQNTFHLKGTGWYVTDYASKPVSKSSETKEEKPVEKASTGNSDES